MVTGAGIGSLVEGFCSTMPSASEILTFMALISASELIIWKLRMNESIVQTEENHYNLTETIIFGVRSSDSAPISYSTE